MVSEDAAYAEGQGIRGGDNDPLAQHVSWLATCCHTHSPPGGVNPLDGAHT